MPPKTCICIICGEEVSKPKSIFMKPLDGRVGRACRKHQEVIDLILKQEKDKQDEKDRKRDEDEESNLEQGLRVIMLAKWARHHSTLNEISIEHAYQFMLLQGMDNQTLTKIKAEVVEQGGETMDADEYEKTTVMFNVISESALPGLADAVIQPPL